MRSMTNETKPYINSGKWRCGVCASEITEYDLHGAPVEEKGECPFCMRKLLWDDVLIKGWRELH